MANPRNATRRQQDAVLPGRGRHGHLLALFATLSLTLAAGACSPDPFSPETADSGRTKEKSVDANVLTLSGLGDLHLGQPLPKGGAWKERGVQISDSCRTVSSPDYPGVYAIVADNRVQRITVGRRSAVKLAEGVGTGSSEDDVRKAFPTFLETSHKYVDAPAKYLTAPDAPSGRPALRFEIGLNREVSLIHAGIMPVLGYVEGCA